jgi:hypothetical protein
MQTEEKRAARREIYRAKTLVSPAMAYGGGVVDVVIVVLVVVV